MNNLIKRARESAESNILSLMAKNNIREIPVREIDGCESPAVTKDSNDEAMTLDFIEINLNGKLVFDASSCDENNTWTIDEMPTDALVAVAEFLAEHESVLSEIQENE